MNKYNMILAINRMTETPNHIFNLKINKLPMDLFAVTKNQAY